MKKTRIMPENHPWYWSMPVKFSQGWRVENANLVFVGGQVSADRQGNVIAPDDIEEQTRNVFENIGLVLREAGAATPAALWLSPRRSLGPAGVFLLTVAARGAGVLARSGEAVEVWPVAGFTVGTRRSLLALAEVAGPPAPAADALDALLGRLREEAPFAVHLGALLRSADESVHEFPGVLARVLLLATDSENHTVRFASAGAVPPLVVGRTGGIVLLDERGPALGLVRDGAWRESGPLLLTPGHLLLATTSGVTETPREDGRTFGEVALRGLLAERRGDTPRNVVRAVLRASAEFGGRAAPSPRTALALRMR